MLLFHNKKRGEILIGFNIFSFKKKKIALI